MISLKDVKIYPELKEGEICLIEAENISAAKEAYNDVLSKGGHPLFLTRNSLADSDVIKKLMSGLKGSKICWDISATVKAGEPPRTTVKGVGRFMGGVLLSQGSKLETDGLALLKEQGFDGVIIAPENLNGVLQ